MTASDSSAGEQEDSIGQSGVPQIDPNALGGDTIELSVRVPEAWVEALDAAAFEESEPGQLVTRSEVTRRVLVDHLAVDDETGEVFLEE